LTPEHFFYTQGVPGAVM